MVKLAKNKITITIWDNNQKCPKLLNRFKNTEKPCYFILLQGQVYLYYGLTNYYQNHRRYVRSRDDWQLEGSNDKKSVDDLNGDCEPFSEYSGNDTDGKSLPIAPCGAIANSLFNGAY